MNRRRTDEDDDDEEEEEEEDSYWDEGNSSDHEWDSDDDVTVPCPYCRREIFDDAERCPYCERYLSDEDSPPNGKPAWIVAIVLLLLFAMYISMFGW